MARLVLNWLKRVFFNQNNSYTEPILVLYRALDFEIEVV